MCAIFDHSVFLLFLHLLVSTSAPIIRINVYVHMYCICIYIYIFDIFVVDDAVKGSV